MPGELLAWSEETTGLPNGNCTTCIHVAALKKIHYEAASFTLRLSEHQSERTLPLAKRLWEWGCIVYMRTGIGQDPFHCIIFRECFKRLADNQIPA